jgi:hypothetical protein
LVPKQIHLNPKNSTRPGDDVYGNKSNMTGVAGFFESLLRKFRTVAFILALLPMYFLAIIAMGLSAAPAIYFISIILDISTGWTPVIKFPILGITFVLSYFIYGFALIFIVPFFNWIFPVKVTEFRGSYFSLQSVPWYIHNAFTYIARYTFLDFITPTPLNTLFYKMMGMKIGKGSQINTTNISDPCMIEIGDKVTIGGSVHLLAHYGQAGYLVISKIRIHDKATIGLKATIMGDTEIGEGAMIGPHEVVLPKSRIPAGRKPDIKNNTENGKNRNR